MKQKIIMWLFAGVLAFICVWILAGGLIGLSGTIDHTAPVISDAKFAEFEAMNAEACTCAQQGQEGCYDDFNKTALPLNTNQVAVACAPIAPDAVCFATQSGERCIIQYKITAGDGSVSVCTSDEAKAYESVYMSTYDLTDDHQQAVEAANRAVIEGLTPANSAPSCVG